MSELQVKSAELKPKLEAAILKLSQQCADKHAAWILYRDEGFESWWSSSVRMHRDLEVMVKARVRCDQMETTVINDSIVVLLMM